ncbi:hypothetical protein Tco_0347282 [Tanacetum coccineum]
MCHMPQTLIVDFDEEFEQMMIHNHSEDPTQQSAMWLFAKPLLKNFSNSTTFVFVLRSNYQKSAVVQGDRVNIQAVKFLVMLKRGILTDEQNDFLFADASRMEEIEELSANICLMARIQPADQNSDDEPSYDGTLETLARKCYDEAAKTSKDLPQKRGSNNKIRTLTSQIEMCYGKENSVLENLTKDNNYLKEFLEADERAKRIQK